MNKMLNNVKNNFLANLPFDKYKNKLKGSLNY